MAIDPLMSLATAACLVLSLVAALRLGAAIYEIGVVDPAWPSNPGIIQPAKGGIDRKRFWIGANVSYELSLCFSLLFGWSIKGLPVRLFAALIPYVVMRGWSFAYFIPQAHKFERAPTSGQISKRAALRWTFFSRFRAVLDAAALAGSMAALAAVIDGSGLA